MNDAHRQAMDFVDEARLLGIRVSAEAARAKYEEAAVLEERRRNVRSELARPRLHGTIETAISRDQRDAVLARTP